MDIEQPDHPMPPITLLKTSTVIEIWSVTEREGHRLMTQRLFASRQSAIECAYGLAARYLRELYHPNYRAYRILSENHGGRYAPGINDNLAGIIFGGRSVSIH
jgi:aspartate 1-decarboxylase